MCSDSDTFNFSAISFGRVILKYELLEDALVIATIPSRMKRVLRIKDSIKEFRKAEI